MQLNFTEYGEDNSGVPLLILHGLFGAHRNWAGVARALSQSRRILALDLPNHGGSPWTDDCGYPAMSDAVAGFMAAQGIAAADIMGHSMGGKTAMTMALMRPELVRRLIVVDIAPVPYDHSSTAEIDAMLAVPLAEVGSRGDADALLAAAIIEPGLRAFLLTNLGRGADGFEWRINLAGLKAQLADLHGFPIAPGACAYDGPTLFIAGALSKYIRPEHGPALDRFFPAHSTQVIDGAGHWVHADDPAALLQVAERFLDRP
ncbi:MAG: alpha/beta fold hydrolase [Rhodospirillaceae bacterium]|nr:alpha/beta fold hydrolase [Rhodospirillaceae bacterium]MBT4116837.1 alpha/beta fold hydrolase [Rhodospirillaceae bacterium]MBT4718711.1 alpha/beta fold hydrolase [Rhodospirillaceae bacterium]MBT4749703.1 alpha/beta fold hydrolase [Rhodospirillaceae bacterium]MBT5838354.1 alpha/beta fold hydrolase [Rhodospirillaceae bacterium]